MAVYRRKYPDGRLSRDWYVSFYVGGRQFKKKIGPNRRSADLYLKDLEVKRVRGELLGIREERRILFADLADKYFDWAQDRKSERRMLDERYVIRRLKDRFPGLASKVTRSDIDGYFSERLQKVGPARYNIELQVIRAIFAKGIEWSYCRANPAAGIRRIKEPPGRVRFLTEEERAALLDACTARLRQILELALDTGLRRGELLSLRWENVDLKNRMIRVEHSKNGERRDVPMTDRVFAILQVLPRRVDTAYLFANPDGTPHAAVSTAWRNALGRSGIQNLRFHDLRHTFASNLVMAGVDIRTVAALLGHKRIEMTMRYAHLAPEHLRDAISLLGSGGPRTKQAHTAESGIS
jgi:integrase